MRILALILAISTTPVAAHELWIEPLAYQVASDGRLEANIVNGEEFEGVILSFLPQSIENFVVFAGEEANRVQGRPGDKPALNQNALAEGLNIVAYQARVATLNYPNWAKFQKFVDHKDLGDVRSLHDARGLPEDDFDEVYGRFSKALIGVGAAAGSDRRVGLETELVALTNPYTDDLAAGMQVQLHYRNGLRSNEQIEVFEKAPDDTVEITLYQTDENGIGTFPVKPGHAYMVDAVVLREPSDQLAAETGAVWQTLWANLTFAVPE